MKRSTPPKSIVMVGGPAIVALMALSLLSGVASSVATAGQTVTAAASLYTVNRLPRQVARAFAPNGCFSEADYLALDKAKAQPAIRQLERYNREQARMLWAHWQIIEKSPYPAVIEAAIASATIFHFANGADPFLAWIDPESCIIESASMPEYRMPHV